MAVTGKTGRKIICAVLTVMSVSPCFLAAQDKPEVSSEVVAPDSKPESLILSEGDFIAGRRGRLLLHTDNKRWFFVLSEANKALSPAMAANNSSALPVTAIKAEDIEAIEVLPSRWLETMLRVVDNKSDYNIEFRVWGNVTVFQGRNFLDISLVATESLFGNIKPESQAARSFSPFSSATDTGNEPQNREDVGVVPQAVRDKLMSIPRVEVVSFSFKMKESDANTVTLEEDKDQKYFSNEMIITNRSGRLFPNTSEGRVYFMFESGDGMSGATQIVIHPCQLLEKMLAKAAGTPGQSLKFRISGRVDEFKGEFFLLPSMYLQESR